MLSRRANSSRGPITFFKKVRGLVCTRTCELERCARKPERCACRAEKGPNASVRHASVTFSGPCVPERSASQRRPRSCAIGTCACKLERRTSLPCTRPCPSRTRACELERCTSLRCTRPCLSRTRACRLEGRTSVADGRPCRPKRWLSQARRIAAGPHGRVVRPDARDPPRDGMAPPRSPPMYLFREDCCSIKFAPLELHRFEHCGASPPARLWG